MAAALLALAALVGFVLVLLLAIAAATGLLRHTIARRNARKEPPDRR